MKPETSSSTCSDKRGEVKLAVTMLLDEDYLENIHLKTFLLSLVEKMSKPKGRNDEPSYLSTQVTFEYLRLRFGDQVEGLIFPSVQTGKTGTNVAFFPESSQPYQVQNNPAENNAQDEPEAHTDVSNDGKLAFVAESLSYHKIVAIETRPHDYDRPSSLFSNDTTR